MNLPVRPPLSPMLGRLARELPEGLLYEPKWDGFRCLAFRDGADVELRSRNDRPRARYFPEVVDTLRALVEPRFVLDGELLVSRAGELDFTSLLGRLHPASSRVERLCRETPALFAAFDVLAQKDDDLRSLPFKRRRPIVEELLQKAPRGIFLTPLTDDVARAAGWLELRGGIDGVVAKDPLMPYLPGVRGMVKVKRERRPTASSPASASSKIVLCRAPFCSGSTTPTRRSATSGWRPRLPIPFGGDCSRR